MEPIKHFIAKTPAEARSNFINETEAKQFLLEKDEFDENRAFDVIRFFKMIRLFNKNGKINAFVMKEVLRGVVNHNLQRQDESFNLHLKNHKVSHTSYNNASIQILISNFRTTIRNYSGDDDFSDHIIQAYQHELVSRYDNEYEVLILVTMWIQYHLHHINLGEMLWDVFSKDMEEKSDFRAYLKEISLDEGPLVDNWMTEKFEDALIGFLQRASEYDSVILDKPKSRNIVILTGGGGFGHKSQAEAMAEFFKEKGFTAHVIETARIDDDPLSKLNITLENGHKLSSQYIHNEWNCRGKEQNLARIFECYARYLESKFSDAYRKTFYRDLRKKIIDLNPRFILDNAGGSETLARLLYSTKTPGMRISSDYLVYQSTFRIINSEKHLPNRLRLFHAGIPYPKVSVMHDKLNRKVTPSYDPFINVVGYPKRGSFKPMTLEEKNQARKKYQIPSGHLVYTIMKGSLGVTEHLQEAINKLIKSPTKLKQPVSVFVVCGKNAEAPPIIHDLVKGYPTKDKPFHFHILGFHREMGILMQISDFLDTKTGGASTAEALEVAMQPASRLKVLGKPELGGEKYNAEILNASGVGKSHDEVTDIVAWMQEDCEMRKRLYVDWKTELLKVVEES